MKIRTKSDVRVFLFFFIILSGCQTVLGPAVSRNSIDQSEKKWINRKIQNYQIEVHYFTLGTDVFTTTEVRDGKVSDTKCIIGPMFENMGGDQCAWFKRAPATFTVPELFNSSRTLVTQTDTLSGDMKKDAFIILFDPQYGFPNKIVWRPPEYTEWDILSFKVLP